MSNSVKKYLSEDIQQSLSVGSKVILPAIPDGLLQGLQSEDQHAILAIVGKPVTLAGYSYGQAELEFIDSVGTEHTIWVDPSILQTA